MSSCGELATMVVPKMSAVGSQHGKSALKSTRHGRRHWRDSGNSSKCTASAGAAAAAVAAGPCAGEASEPLEEARFSSLSRVRLGAVVVDGRDLRKQPQQ